MWPSTCLWHFKETGGTIAATDLGDRCRFVAIKNTATTITINKINEIAALVIILCGCECESGSLTHNIKYNMDTIIVIRSAGWRYTIHYAYVQSFN